MILSNAIFLVNTDHGRIVYSLQPQHLNDRQGTTLRGRCMDYGEQMAVFNQGNWYRPGMRELISDARTIALLERVATI